MRTIALTAALLALLACGGGEEGGGGGNAGPGDAAAGGSRRPWHVARSAEGDFVCEIRTVQPERGPDGEPGSAVTLEFGFPEIPADAILDRDMRVPRALRPDGENRAGHWAFKALLPLDRGVALPALHIGPGVDTVSLLQIEATAARVVDSRGFVFEDLGRGESEPLRCRAFELLVTGEEESASVTALLLPEYAAEHAEYHMDVPPTVASHQWAVGAVEVTDAKGRALAHRGGGGGADRSTARFAPPANEAVVPAPIEYPLTVRIRVPTRVRMEEVVFQFRGIPIEPFSAR